ARTLAGSGGTRVAVAVGGRTADVLDDPYAARVLTAAAGVAAPREVGVWRDRVAQHAPAAPARLARERGGDGVGQGNP
ncbi:hypothetical protein K7G98_43795, partial [Saccharothrix sp. MB29]|nr:hypothetical protein [Saccharothrix sp. MB29]